MRGTRCASLCRWCGFRFIPAYAGNATSLLSTSLSLSVHPRVCGERLPGLPPGLPLPRFIPAYAGNAGVVAYAASCASVHPRVCGERCACPATGDGHTGSSPRMRGTRNRSARNPLIRRFIPAYAGNAQGATRAETAHAGSSPRMRGTRLVGLTGRWQRAVHPRVCGERLAPLGFGILPRGSSPRMRGTPTRSTGKRSRWRFIPAYAGNATEAATSCLPRPVHPRVCGERPRKRPQTPANAGSSPRMRGTLMRENQSLLPQRFIPAYAGNAIRCVSGCAFQTVHPRVCGERFRLFPRCSLFVGSSPRMRGTPPKSFRPRRSRRFIPAYAGNAG